RQELSEKFYLDYYDINDNYPYLMPRIGLEGYSTLRLHIDIFKLVGLPSGLKRRTLFKRKGRFFRHLFTPKMQNEEYFGYSNLKGKVYNYLMKCLLLPVSSKMIIRRYEKHCTKYQYSKAEYVAHPHGSYGLKEIVPKELYG